MASKRRRRRKAEQRQRESERQNAMNCEQIFTLRNLESDILRAIDAEQTIADELIKLKDNLSEDGFFEGLITESAIRADSLSKFLDRTHTLLGRLGIWERTARDA